MGRVVGTAVGATDPRGVVGIALGALEGEVSRDGVGCEEGGLDGTGVGAPGLYVGGGDGREEGPVVGVVVGTGVGDPLLYVGHVVGRVVGVNVVVAEGVVEGADDWTGFDETAVEGMCVGASGVFVGCIDGGALSDADEGEGVGREDGVDGKEGACGVVGAWVLGEDGMVEGEGVGNGVGAPAV